MSDPTDSLPAQPATEPPRKRAGLLRSSLIFSGLTLVSRFAGLARDLVITARLGASSGPAADAYYTALSFPNLFRRIFAEGAFSAAFIPSYTKSLAANGEEKADILAAEALAALAAITLVICVAAQLAMPWLMYGINPGYASDPVKFKLAIVLTQISMPYLPCMAITALLSGVLNAHGRFILSGAAPIVLNLVMLAAVLPAHGANNAAFAATWAIVAAGIAQAALLWWGCWKTGARIKLRWPSLTADVKALIALAVPGAIAASATQINVFVSQSLVSLTHTNGPRSWLNIADRFYQLPLGLVGVAIGVALLPRLAASLQADDKADVQATTDQAFVFGLALTLPAAAALVAMPLFLIDGLYTRGDFTFVDAEQTAKALLFYGIGTPAFVLARIMNPIFFARGDTKSPMRFALISVAVNILAGVALFKLIGFQGIAAATALASWINVGQMAWALNRKGIYHPSAKAIGKILRVFAASAGMAVVLMVLNYYRLPIIEALKGVAFHKFGAKEIAVIGAGLIGMATYPLFLLGFGGVTLAEIRTVLRRRKA
ncbi:putative peptidoglycan lipid II flippase [Caulobacter ginsengisoli]|uniref:Probable lipid II flippase MurJ n=1 Tax=Caulobacter ginsengisoli TaxID=400775 RepID=A0ABU0IYA5_9CAUL|nr:murein biosynthesis integral membrane protein MurJ [Caulobacter ginsengisoli]MDQ0467001.1 putative peptidoglycan lipid II flippase [Caulobacter ginsengisoli]